jgi:hypothetical protein
MTIEEARACAAANAFVKWNPKDGAGSWLHGRAQSISGNYLCIKPKHAAGFREYRIHHREASIDKIPNESNGIRLQIAPPAPKDPPKPIVPPKPVNGHAAAAPPAPVKVTHVVRMPSGSYRADEGVYVPFENARVHSQSYAEMIAEAVGGVALTVEEAMELETRPKDPPPPPPQSRKSPCPPSWKAS